MGNASKLGLPEAVGEEHKDLEMNAMNKKYTRSGIKY